MSFESKLNKQYNKIANHVSDMIPGPWEKVYLVAYMKGYASQVIFFLQFHRRMNFIIQNIYQKILVCLGINMDKGFSIM